jgi:hypothetical protein
MGKKIKLPEIPEEERTPLVEGLLGIIEQLTERVQRQEKEIGRLKDEIAVLKGEMERPRIKPSKLDQEAGKDTAPIRNTDSGVLAPALFNFCLSVLLVSQQPARGVHVSPGEPRSKHQR